MDAETRYVSRNTNAALALLVTTTATALLAASIPIKIGIVSGVASITGAIATPVAYMLFAIVGAAVVLRRPGHRVGWLFAVSGLGWALMWFCGVVVESAHESGTTPPDPVTWLAGWTEIIGIASVVASLFLFPNGRLLSPRWRIWIGVTIPAAALAIAAEGFAPGPLEDYPYFDNPYGITELFGQLRVVGWPSLIIPLFAAPVALVVRYRRASGDERQQLKWMLLGGAVLVMFICFWATTAGVFGDDRLAESLQGLGIAPIPIAAGIAILKYRLYDIDVVINRTLVYGLLTTILAGAYVALVFGLQAVLTPFAAESDLAIAGSTLAVAALFRPVRERVQGFIDKRFYRRKIDAQTTIDRFSAHLRDEVQLDAISRQLVEVVRDTMQPVHVSLWLRPEPTR